MIECLGTPANNPKRFGTFGQSLNDFNQILKRVLVHPPGEIL